MVIGVLLTMAPLTLLTSKLPLSLFSFFLLGDLFAVLGEREREDVGATRRDVDHGRGERDPSARLGRRSATRPSLRALAGTVRLTWLVHEVLVSWQVSRTLHVLV